MGFFQRLKNDRLIEEFIALNKQLLNAFNHSFPQQFGIPMNIQMYSFGGSRTDYDDDYLEVEFDVRNQRALVFFTIYRDYYNDKRYNGYRKGNNVENFVMGKHIYMFQLDPSTGRTSWRLLKKMNRQELFDRMVEHGVQFGGYKNLQIRDLRAGTVYDSINENGMRRFSYEMVYDFGFQKGYKNAIND